MVFKLLFCALSVGVAVCDALSLPPSLYDKLSKKDQDLPYFIKYAISRYQTTTTEAPIFMGKEYEGQFAKKSASRYVLSDEKLSWDKALENCENRGMILAGPSGDEIQDLREFIRDNEVVPRDPYSGYWVGGHRVNQDYQWVSNQQIVTNGWLIGEPNGFVGEDCVEFKYDYRSLGWNNNYCHIEKRFICETIISNENEKNIDRGRQSAYGKYPGLTYPGFHILQVPKAFPEIASIKEGEQPEQRITSKLNADDSLNLPNIRLEPSTDSLIDSLNQVATDSPFKSVELVDSIRPVATDSLIDSLDQVETDSPIKSVELVDAVQPVATDSLIDSLDQVATDSPFKSVELVDSIRPVATDSPIQPIEMVDSFQTFDDPDSMKNGWTQTIKNVEEIETEYDDLGEYFDEYY